MPKTGPTDSQWAKRIAQYAANELQFSKGQHPATDSKWGKEKQKIDSCPLFKSGTGKDLFGHILSCTCGYHKVSIKL